MTKYVALLRGIVPSNPNMRNERLRQVAEGVGLGEVATVISSGNVVFETDRADVAELERILQEGWKERLGFDSTTIIRSREDLAATEKELFTVTDTTSERTPKVMAWLEGRFGKEVSSRTWLTVERILKKMSVSK